MRQLFFSRTCATSRRWLSSSTQQHLRPPRRRPPQHIVFGSCSSQYESQQCWKTIQAQNPDLLVLMGDNVYAQESSDIHAAYQSWGASSAWKSLAASVPVLATLDDNDYTTDHETGKQAFLDFFKISGEDERRQAGRGVHVCTSWGDGDDRSLQLILLDVRYYAKNSCLLGDDQWDWLRSCLDDEKQEQPSLRVIVSPMQVLATGHPWECWDRNAPTEREMLLDLLRSNRTPTLLVSGDRHVGALHEQQQHSLEDDDENDESIVEMTTSSLTHSVSPPGILDAELDVSRRDPSHRVEGYFYDNNFGSIQVDWTQRRVTVALHRVQDGSILAAWKRPFG